MKKQFTIFLILVFVLGLVPINFSSATDLATKLKGKILLQVESNGEAWYVDSKTGEKNYMANGDEAYNIMRNLGIGINNKDLEKIQNNKSLAVKHSGKIFLQVESHGEAYYVDFSGSLHYLKNGTEAYGVMRKLGLGITNKNLEKINISIKSKLPLIKDLVGNIKNEEEVKPNNQSTNVVEENFSDVVVKLYAAQLEALQSTMNMNEKAKNIFAGIKQTWNDELIKTQVYLKTYPNDSGLIRDEKFYDLAVQLSDNSIQQLNDKDAPGNGVKEILQNDINLYKNKKVVRAEMQNIFADIDLAAKFNKLYSDQLSALYKKLYNNHHEMSVRIDAVHNVEAAKKQQEIKKTDTLIAQTNRIIEYAQASIQQSRNALNSMIASQPTYCTATRTMPGSVSVICNQ